MRRVKPHQVVLAVGCARRAVHPCERGRTGADPLARPLDDPSRGLHQRPDRDEGRVLRLGLDDAAAGRLARVAARAQLRARRTRRPSHEPQERRATFPRLPQRCIDADIAARPGRRSDALVHLFRVHRPVHGHRHARSRSSDARRAEVLARSHVRGVLGVRRRDGCRVPDRNHVGDRAAVRAASLSDPHQDEA